MNFLPTEIENIILDYKFDLEYKIRVRKHKKKFKYILSEIKEMKTYRCNAHSFNYYYQQKMFMVIWENYRTRYRKRIYICKKCSDIIGYKEKNRCSCFPMTVFPLH